MTFRSVPIAVALLGLTVAAPTQAVQRTFVASTGNDANPCSLTMPCRQFAAAIVQTSPGGEIVVLDSGGYGPVTITKSVSIIAPAGIYAGVTVSGPDGVTIDGPGVVVRLRGLSINGEGGMVGIDFLRGSRLDVENCTVTGMAASGISITAANAVTGIVGTTSSGNTGHGVEFVGTTKGSVVASRSENNALDGFHIADGAAVSIADSVASRNGSFGLHATNTLAATTVVSADRLEAVGNSTGALIQADFAGSKSIADITRANLSQNQVTGLQVGTGAEPGIVAATLSDSLLARNGHNGVQLLAPNQAWQLTLERNRIVESPTLGICNDNSAGTLKTRGDNVLSGNLIDVSGTLTPLAGR
jgi:hypothetical protein